MGIRKRDGERCPFFVLFRLQLADMSLTQKAISRIETGDRAVLDYELKYFSAVLGVSVAELLGIEEDYIKR